MKNHLKIIAAGALIALGGVVGAAAEDGIGHYAPEPSETLAEAIENFVAYNRRMAEVLARDPLNVQDMEEVHELTYTLEVALARINAELGALPVVLEEVHRASEGDNPARLRGVAGVYLEQARLLDR